MATQTAAQKAVDKTTQTAANAATLAINDATTAYQSGLGAQPYTGSLVAPMSTQQVQGMSNHMAVAANAQPYLNASLANIGTQAANASGMTPAQQAAMNAQTGIMNNPLSASQTAAQTYNTNMMNAGGLTPSMQGQINTQQGVVNAGGYNAGMTNAQGINQGVVNSGGYNANMTQGANTQQGIINQGGLTPQMQGDMKRLEDLAKAGGLTPDQKIALDNYRKAASGTGLTAEQEQAQARMNAISGGSMLNANPYLDKVIGQNAQDITRAQQMASSGAGRYGSGGFQAVTQNQIGRMANTARAENYARERGLQDAATQQMFGMGQTGQTNLANANQALFGAGQQGQANMLAATQAAFGMGQTGQGNVSSAGMNLANLGQTAQGNVMSAGNNIGNLGNTALGNMSNASQQAFGMGNTGIGNATTAGNNAATIGQQGINNRGTAATNVYDMGQAGQQQNNVNNQALQGAYTGALQPGTTMQQVGQNYQNLAQANINDQKRIYNETQAQPWNQIGLFQGALQGPGTTQGGQPQPQEPSAAQSALGMGAFGYQVSGGNPWAAGAGALYGYGDQQGWW